MKKTNKIKDTAPSKLQINFLRRVLKNGWHSLLRNKLLSLATIFIIALMLFVFNVVLALSLASDSIIKNVGEKLDVSVEIQEGVEDYELQTFIQTLESNPKVKEVFLVNKDEALDRLDAKYPDFTVFLNRYNLDNPLPTTLRIVATDLADNNQIIAALETPQFSQIINQGELMSNLEQKERNEKILSVTQSIKRLSFWLILIFAIVAVMIIFNGININIHNHEKEVQIMKLVGAKYSFIRGGFVVEGIIFAISALLLSFLFSQLTLAYLESNLILVINNENLLAGFNAVFVHFKDRLLLTLAWQFLAALSVGLLSSYLAIELYLRKEHAF